LTLAIGIQTVFIIGGVMRALPLVGITLPFVSYGGSSLLTSFASLAILLLVSQSEGSETTRHRAFEEIQIGFSIAWLGLAFIAGWWTIYRSPGLVVRTDNPRRALDSRFVERGQIWDRNGVILAESIGSPGEYERRYRFPAAAPFIGFDSAIYGQAGIESSMDTVLRGLERGTFVENTWQRLITGHPPPGQDIALTIDIDLQSLSMDLLHDQIGAAVLLEASSGELYVVASQPTYNPNEIDEDWGELIQDERAPLFNRATQGLYQPGLSIAPFLFSETLVSGMVTPEDSVTALSSVVSINGLEISCLRAPPQAVENNVEVTLRYGCPHPLQQIFMDAGWDQTRTAIESFGFTEVTDVGLQTARPVELVNDPSERELAQFVVGQGELQVSPLQMARAIAGLFSNQQIAPINLVQAIEASEGIWVMQEAEGYRVPLSAKAVVSDLRKIYATGNSDLFELRAEALIDDEGQRLGWYLGAMQHDSSLWTIVVALEGDSAHIAEDIGRQILAAAQQLSP
jgi:peptidoglycan glycosyltransferase